MTVEYRKGDVVNVRAVVKYDYEGEDDVLIVRPASTEWSSGFAVKPDDLELIHHAFAIGDTVTDDEDETFEIVAVHGLQAWCKDAEGELVTKELVELEHYAAPEQLAQAAE